MPTAAELMAEDSEYRDLIAGKTGMMRFTEMRAMFIRVYGYSAWKNAVHPTRDHIVPFGEFLGLWRTLPMLRAQERAEVFTAQMLAIANTMGADEGRKEALKTYNEAHRVAYPWQYRTN